MTRRLFTLISAGIVSTGALVVAAAGSAGAAVGGPTCNVPGDYSTIQAAVSDPGCTTVNVAAGTYNENVVIGHSLTLKGAQAGDNVAGRTAAGPHESTVKGATDTPSFTVNAPNVTIDGFSVNNQNHGLGVTVKTAGNKAVIKNDIIDTIGGSAYSSNSVGVYLENGPDNVTVSGNRISNVESGPSAQGVLVGDSTAADPSLDVVLANNSISNVTSTNKGAYGIQLNNGASSSSSATGYTTGKITGNNINNLSGNWVHAIGLEGDTPNIAIKRNTVSNLVSPGADKVAVWFEDNAYFFTADVNRNNLAVGTSAYGIAVNPALTTHFPTLSVDGTCNYWGAKNGPGPVGPGSGSLVSPGVDFKPWLKSANLNGQCGDNGHHDYNDSQAGHRSDDKDRGNFWENN